MFAVLYLERDPLRLANVPDGLLTWVRIVGSVAALCLLFWLPHRLLRGWGQTTARPWVAFAFNVLVTTAAFGFAMLLILRVPDLLSALSSDPTEPDPGWVYWTDLLWTASGAAALLAVCLPFFVNLIELRGRRIWAIARLSLLEAVRQRVLFVFAALILVLLFLNWFVQSKPEAQLQSYVEIVYRTMKPLLLLSAGLLGAFAIPTDIKKQTIHTVTTKPVERFEIVLGRFVGYTLLVTLMLFAMTTLSLFYVLRGINPAAAEESLKARVPVYGTLDFVRVEGEYTERETVEPTDPDNVGREWDYRKYISAQPEDRPREATIYAVWSFRDLPKGLANRDTVRCEFNFDIYRQHKGQENLGVFCSFYFETRNYEKTRANLERYKDARRAKGLGVKLNAEVDNTISQEFGYFEFQSKKIEDFHTLYVDVPAGLIRNALGPPSDRVSPDAPPLVVRVRCGSPGQLIGMARYDLYLRADDPESGRDTFAFVVNFYKGALGLWMVCVLVVALSVFISTELGGIIAFLCVILLLLGGQNRDFIKELTLPDVAGGGPLESAFRLFGRTGLSEPLEESTAQKIATGSDHVFRWAMRGVLNVLPDEERFDFTDRVANGFDVGVVEQDLLPAFIMLLGYLFPWALLSFYLIRNREIAGAN